MQHWGKQGSPDSVPVDERIATFDNDDTLWAEQPMYFQLFFALDRVKALAPQHPEWKTQEPFASLLKDDVKGALSGGMKSVGEIVMATHAGMSTEEFEMQDGKAVLLRLPELNFNDDKGLDEAQQKGWTVVYMKQDWKVIYPPAKS